MRIYGWTKMYRALYSFFFMWALLEYHYLPFNYQITSNSKTASIYYGLDPALRNGIVTEREQIAILPSRCMFWNCQNPPPPLSLPLPFLVIETLLIFGSSAHCRPIRWMIHLGEDDNSQWHTAVPRGLQTVWLTIGVKWKCALHLLINPIKRPL